MHLFSNELKGVTTKDALVQLRVVCDNPTSRKLSRRKALKNFNYNMLRAQLKEAGVTLLGAGLDEAPMAYKNIHEVIAAQQNLIEVLGTFTPKVVRKCHALIKRVFYQHLFPLFFLKK